MAKLARTAPKRLGDILIDEGLLSQEQLDHARDEQRRTGELLCEALVRLGLAAEEDVAGAIVRHYGLPFIKVDKYAINDQVAKSFPERFLRQYIIMPLDRIGSVTTLVAANVTNEDMLAELERIAGSRVQLFVGLQADVKSAIQERFGDGQKQMDLSSLGSMLLGED